jgi:Rrf2 family protein
MPYSTKLSDALHIMAFIETEQGNDLSSDAIAYSLASNPATVRQIMGKLKRAGLLESTAGHARPRLARPPRQITMLDVYRAVEGPKPLLHLDTHTNPACGVGANVQVAIGEYFHDVQDQAEQAMAQISLADILERFQVLAARPRTKAAADADAIANAAAALSR